MRASIVVCAALLGLLARPDSVAANVRLRILEVHLAGEVSSTAAWPNHEVHAGEFVTVRVYYTNDGTDPVEGVSGTFSTAAPRLALSPGPRGGPICLPGCRGASVSAGTIRFSEAGEYGLEVNLFHPGQTTNVGPAALQTIRFRVTRGDVLPPVAHLESSYPSAGERMGLVPPCLPVTPLRLHIGAEDADSGVRSIRYSITGPDGGVSNTNVTEASGRLRATGRYGPSYREVEHDLTLTATGDASIDVQATDGYGHVGTLSARFTYDATPPTLRIIPPPGGRIEPGRSNRLTAEVSDRGCGVDNVRFELLPDGGSVQRLGQVRTGTFVGTTGVVRLDADVVAQPRQLAVLRVWAVDRAQHSTSAELRTSIGDAGVQFIGPAAGQPPPGGRPPPGGSGSGSGMMKADLSGIDLRLAQLEQQLTAWQAGRDVPKGSTCVRCYALTNRVRTARRQIRGSIPAGGEKRIEMETLRLESEVRMVGLELRKGSAGQSPPMAVPGPTNGEKPY